MNKHPIVAWFEKALKDYNERDLYSGDAREGVIFNYQIAKEAYDSLINDISKRIGDLYSNY